MGIVSGKCDQWIYECISKSASQVTVTLSVDQKDYARIGGIQSTMGALVGIFQPVLATTILNTLGLQWILIIDLSTFLVAFLVLLFVVEIPDEISSGKQTFDFRNMGWVERRALIL